MWTHSWKFNRNAFFAVVQLQTYHSWGLLTKTLLFNSHFLSRKILNRCNSATYKLSFVTIPCNIVMTTLQCMRWFLNNKQNKPAFHAVVHSNLLLFAFVLKISFLHSMITHWSSRYKHFQLICKSPDCWRLCESKFWSSYKKFGIGNLIVILIRFRSLRFCKFCP